MVDTPGWCPSSNVSSVLAEIARGVSMCPPGPHAFLLVIPADRPFTEEDKKATSELMDMISKSVWRNTIVVFTYGDSLKDKSIEEYIESEGDNLKCLLEKCEYRYHVMNCYGEESHSQVSVLLKKVDELIVRNRGKPFRPEGKKPSGFHWFPRPKTLTEDEWIKREDDLIDRMLAAVVAEPEIKPVEGRDGSIDFHIPNSK